MDSKRIKKILKELETHCNIDKELVFENAIRTRLNRSLKTYYNDLARAFGACETYSKVYGLKMIKNMNKEE